MAEDAVASEPPSTPLSVALSAQTRHRRIEDVPTVTSAAAQRWYLGLSLTRVSKMWGGRIFYNPLSRLTVCVTATLPHGARFCGPVSNPTLSLSGSDSLQIFVRSAEQTIQEQLNLGQTKHSTYRNSIFKLKRPTAYNNCWFDQRTGAGVAAARITMHDQVTAVFKLKWVWKELGGLDGAWGCSWQLILCTVNLPPREVPVLPVPRAAKAVGSAEPTCSVCMDWEATMAFVPCGHMCVCQACAARLKQDPAHRCVICRTPWTALVFRDRVAADQRLFSDASGAVSQV